MEKIKKLLVDGSCIVFIVFLILFIVNLIWNGFTNLTIFSGKMALTLYLLLSIYNHFVESE